MSVLEMISQKAWRIFWEGLEESLKRRESEFPNL